jgi:tetratricopeptide (TPR) repeat protein
MNYAKVFIASSVEGLNIAYAIQELLEHSTDCTVWDQGVFEASSYTMDALEIASNESDYGIFVFSPDDIIKQRGETYTTIRDNVIFEFGLFIHSLGRERCFIVEPHEIKDFHFPTDLTGLKHLTYRTDRNDDNLLAALGPCVNEIRRSIEKYGLHTERSTNSPSVQPKEKGGPHIINLPHTRNPYFTGRTEILDVMYDNFHDDNDKTHLKRVQSVRGLGGIGKSSIVLEYAYKHRLEYQTIWWVNAESSNTVLSSYKEFGLKQGLVSEDDKDNVVIEKIQSWFFDNEYWLFIYDNADAADYDSWFESYLPKERNGHILITTKSYTFKKSKSIDIGVLNETEAVSFLKIRTDKSGEGYSDDSAKELAKLLGYLPLALEQAAAYITETPEVIYRDYINLFNEYGIEVFNTDASLVDYSSTITVTWKISMAKITNENAVRMFNMCAYFAPDAMPVEMFMRGNEVLPKPLQSGISDHLQRDAILADLVRYSLLGCERSESIPGDEKRLLSMHRLLQEVVQKNIGSETRWLEHGLELMFYIADWEPEYKDSVAAFKIESPHAAVIAEKTQVVFKDDSAKMMNAAVIFHATARIYRKLSFLELAMSHCTKCIDILERYCAEDNPEKNKNYLFLAYVNRGQTSIAMTAYDKAIKDYDKSIAIGEQLRIEGKLYLHFESALAMAYMDRGIAYEYMQLHDQALLDKNKSIEVYERLCDENGLALAYLNRGATYGLMDNYNEALSDYNKGIEIWEKLKNEGRMINETGLANTYLNKGIVSSKLEMEEKQMEELKKDLGNLNHAIQVFEDMRQTGKLFDENELAVAYARRGMFYFQIKMHDKSIMDFNKAIEIMECLLKEGKSPNANELAKAYSSRGMAYYMIGKYVRALPDITECIAIWEDLQKKEQLIEESTLFNMYIIRGGVLNKMPDYMGVAISDFQKSIKIAESLKMAGQSYDEDGLADAYMGIAIRYDQEEKFAEANKHYDQCIDIWDRLLSKGQPLTDEENLATAYMNRGLNYYLMEENDKALSDYNKCITIRERLQSQGVQQDPYLVSVSYGNRARSYEAAHNTTAAIQDYMSALRVLKEVFSELPDLQELYYDILDKLIDLFDEESNDALFNDVLQEFLYAMRSVPKTEEAEEAQNDIIEQLN